MNEFVWGLLVEAGRILAVVLGCVAAAVVVIGVAIWWMRRRGAHDSSDGNHWSKMRFFYSLFCYLFVWWICWNIAADEDGSGEFIRSIAGSHLSFKYEVLSKATDNFSQINKLGHGGYGSVYKVLKGRGTLFISVISFACLIELVLLMVLGSVTRWKRSGSEEIVLEYKAMGWSVLQWSQSHQPSSA